MTVQIAIQSDSPIKSSLSRAVGVGFDNDI